MIELYVILVSALALILWAIAGYAITGERR